MILHGEDSSFYSAHYHILGLKSIIMLRMLYAQPNPGSISLAKFTLTDHDLPRNWETFPFDLPAFIFSSTLTHSTCSVFQLQPMD